MNNDDQQPVRVVFNQDGLVVWAGQPKPFSTKESKEYTQPGYEIKTMTIKEYRESDFKWIYDIKH